MTVGSASSLIPCRSRFLTGVYNEELGTKVVTWINASGAEMKPEEWSDVAMQCLGMLLDGRAQPTGIRKHGEDATLLMVMNGHHDLVRFSLPETVGGSHRKLLIDINLADDAEMGSFATDGPISTPHRELGGPAHGDRDHGHVS